MPTLSFFVTYLQKYRFSKKPLYILSLMILFWAIFDGIMSYITPLIMVNGGLSKTMMGIIIGTSSITGAAFDFLACRIFKNTLYKRMYLWMFLVCLIYPFIIFKANTIILYLIAMALWGIYYDFKNIGNFDFVGQHTEKKEHADSFGLIQVVQGIGYLIAPILVGFLVAESIGWEPFALAWVFLIIAIIFFIYLNFLPIKKSLRLGQSSPNLHRKVSVWSEVNIWGKIGKILLPVLILTLFLNIIESFFWTVGPIFAESLSSIHEFAGFFMTAWTLPSLLVGWIVGSITRKCGKKRTAFTSLLIGSLFLVLIIFLKNPIIIILDVFVASFFMATAWPAINGAYADYISETGKYEKEIEGLEDFYTNLGFIVGPMAAGFIADQLGNAGAFNLLGIVGVIIAILLLIFTPKKINIAKELKAN